MAEKVELWVSKIIAYSSQYDNQGWSASSVVGTPRVYPRYGDITGAWAPGVIDNAQYLELEFSEHLFISKIDIYETFNAGALKSVSVRRPDDGKWVAVWKTDTPQAIHQSRIFSPDIQCTTFKTNQLRLDVDCSACGTWAEIDSVMVTGHKHKSAPPPMETLSSDLEKLVDSPSFSDVSFSVQDKTFHAHKAILAMRSEYFKAMFASEMLETSSEKPIQLKSDMTSDVFLAVLHYLYTNRVPDSLNCRTLTSVWRVADLFSIDGLKALATFKVEKGLDTENVVQVYVEATKELPVIDEIKEMCLNYISNHMSNVSRSPEFMVLDQETMLEIVQNATARLTL